MFFKIIGLFFLKNILIIHNGALAAKLKATFSISLAISPFALALEKIAHWYIDNYDYIMWVLWAIIADWLIGQILHIFITKDFSWKKMCIGVLVKVGMAILAGSLFEALPHFLHGESFAADGLLMITRLSVFMYPASSAWMNTSEITGGRFPPIGWTKKIKLFNENLDFRALQGTSEPPAQDDQNFNNQI